MPLRETSTDYARPFRPAPVALANRAGRAVAAIRAAVGVGDRPLTADALMRLARRKTGLTDFGEESFREPLERLCASIEAEAALSPVGRVITRTRLAGILAQRLHAERLFRAHPEILAEEVVAPIVVVGLQRTGTTMLHRLLAADPGLRSLRSWESLQPTPAPARPWHRRDPRVGAAVFATRAAAYLAPDFFAVHPIEAEAPEEEVLLLDYTFLSTVAEATLRVPSFSRWLEEQDQTPAYAYMKKLLQLLQWQSRGERWVLKTPHHMEWLDTLLAVFPDARVVHTHRDPRRTMASFCSMIAHGRGLLSDEVDPVEVGRDWSLKIARLVARATATRDRLAGDGSPFLDVQYRDLMADPMAEVRRIYGFAGRELTPAIEDAMEASRRANRKDRHGKHVYRLADFGLDEARIDELLGGYVERFAIPREDRPPPGPPPGERGRTTP